MADALHVLMVSPDRSLLRQGALMLEEFGVRVTACGSAEHGRQALVGQAVDFLLLDESIVGKDLAAIEAWKRSPGDEHVHLLLLCGEHSPLDIHEAFQFGADDFLRKPLGAGELLARLRAAARYAEFERRCQEQAWDDPVTGLWARQALVDRLESDLKFGTRGRKLSLVALEVDYFDRIERYHGEIVSQRVLQRLKELLESHGVAGQFVARLQGGRFAVLLSDHSQEKAVKFAERLRAAVEEQAVEVLGGEERLTASAGVATSLADHDHAEAALGRALQALRDAQRSGHNCVVAFGQYDEERRRWSQQMSTGNPFASCVARDVMTPFALEVAPTETLAYAETLFAQSRLEVLPAIDQQGRVVGLLQRERLLEALQTSSRPAQAIDALLSREVPKLPENSSIEAVIEQFVAEDQPLLVIVSKEGRARGFIDRERFLDLVSPMQPADRSEMYSSTTDYLVVPECVES